MDTRMNGSRTLLTLGTALALTALPGCIVVAGGSKTYVQARPVDKDEIWALRDATSEIHIGMSKQDVLGRYPADLLSLRGTSVGERGEAYEAWRLYAVSRNGRTTLTRWFVFRDGALVELSDERIDWEDPERRASWGTFAPGY